jgi:hypothetical protein
MREHFDTGVAKIRTEIKTRLVPHGLFGTVTAVDVEPADPVPSGATIRVTAKSRTVERKFDRRQIEECRLKVAGVVLAAIISLIDELSAEPDQPMQAH